MTSYLILAFDDGDLTTDAITRVNITGNLSAATDAELDQARDTVRCHRRAWAGDVLKNTDLNRVMARGRTDEFTLECMAVIREVGQEKVREAISGIRWDERGPDWWESLKRDFWGFRQETGNEGKPLDPPKQRTAVNDLKRRLRRFAQKPSP